jgi:hypothetical protein
MIQSLLASADKSLRRHIPERAMRPRGIVVHSPGFDFLLGIIEIEKPVLIEALVSKAAILIRAKENRRLACVQVFHHDGQPVGDFKKSWHKALKEAKLGHV